MTGTGMSQQSYGLRKKIFEIDRLYAAAPTLFEVHPEVSFRALAGRELAHSKKSWNGLAERLELLAHEGIAPGLQHRLNGTAAPDDVVDAVVAAWSANRIATGTAGTLPETPGAIYAGRPVAIWY
jgi:predicted RNase H-like nuclease